MAWNLLKKKTKFSRINTKIELALFNDSWIGQHPSYQIEGHSERVHKIQGFYRQEAEARKLLAIAKKGLFQARSHSFGGKGEGLSCRPSLLPLGWGMERAHVTYYLIGADQKIPDWPIKTAFLGRSKLQIRSGIQSRFGIRGFSTSDTISSLQFSL